MGEAGAATIGVGVYRVLVPVGDGVDPPLPGLELGLGQDLSLLVHSVELTFRVSSIENGIVVFILLLTTDSSDLIIRYLGGKHLDTILMVDSGKDTGHLANKDEPVIQGHSRHISVKILGWGSC